MEAEARPIFTTFLAYFELFVLMESAVFLARGSMALGAREIAIISSTFLGFNATLLNSLAAQRSDARVGVVLLILGVAAQGFGLAGGARFDDFAPANPWGVVLALLAAGACAVAGCGVRLVYSGSAQWPRRGGFLNRRHLALAGREAQIEDRLSLLQAPPGGAQERGGHRQ